MAKVEGHMNIPFSERYDAEDDIYYVTFKTGEPSYCQEVDDVLLIERGIFTKLPTGFRILNFHKNPVGGIKLEVVVRFVKSVLERTQRDLTNSLRTRESQFEQALGKVLAR